MTFFAHYFYGWCKEIWYKSVKIKYDLEYNVYNRVGAHKKEPA